MPHKGVVKVLTYLAYLRLHIPKTQILYSTKRVHHVV